MPKASVIIPCYNAERFVEEAVRSALAQTVRDIEVICVDDGSTDGTLAILRELAGEDPRIRIIVQENGGEGRTRNAGLEVAQGEWIYCLDADDIMEPTLLEEAIACGTRTSADMVIFRSRLLDNQTGKVRDFRWCFVTSWLPKGTEVFDPADYPDHIMNSFQNWVHNKLFHASFVHERDLRFQHLYRAADLLFVCRALTEAHRIALLDRPLHRYRVNNPKSALVTSDSHPLDFYEGFLELRKTLEENGTWERYRLSFVNWACEGVAGNLERLRSVESFMLVADTMREEGLARLDIPSLSREDADNLTQWEVCRAVEESQGAELLLRMVRILYSQGDRSDAVITRLVDGVRRRDKEIAKLRKKNESLRKSVLSKTDQISQCDEEIARLRESNDDLRGSVSSKTDQVRARDKEIARLKQKNENLRGSVSFRAGRALTAPLRAMRNLINGRRA